MDTSSAQQLVGRFFVDPHFRGAPANELFAGLPVDAPAMLIGEQWVVSDHAVIRRLAASPSLIMARAEFPVRARLDNPEFVDFFSENLFFKPLTEHNRLKALLTSHFVPGTMRAIAAPTRRMAEDLFARAVMDGAEFDVVAAVANRLPALVAATLIGVPPERRDWLADQAAGLLSALCNSFPSTGGDVNTPIDQAGFAQLRAYLEELLLTSSATAGSLGRVLSAALRDGSVDLNDAAELLMLLLMAGVDTVITGIANAVSVLLDHPRDLDRIRDGRLDAGAAFAEALRLFTPVPFARRQVVTSTTVAGLEFRAGQDVLLCLAGGNRDPRHFDAPHEWRPDRGRSGLSFGHGVYHCVGVALGSVEGAAVLAALANLGGVRRCDDGSVWNSNVGFHSPAVIKVSTT